MNPPRATEIRASLHHVADLIADWLEAHAPPTRRPARTKTVPVDDLTRQLATNELQKRGWDTPRRAGGAR